MFNTWSLSNKFSDLESLAASDDFHIIGVSESWINTENKDFLSEYNLFNYSMFICERQDEKKVGEGSFDLRDINQSIIGGIRQEARRLANPPTPTLAITACKSLCKSPSHTN